MNLLPGRPVEAECIGPWRRQRDTAWKAWGGEPARRSGRCWEASLKLGGTRESVRWPPLSSWRPGGCSPWLQIWRRHPGCPARSISPEAPGPALASSDVGLTLVPSYNRLRNKKYRSRHVTASVENNRKLFSREQHAPMRLFMTNNAAGIRAHLIIWPDRKISNIYVKNVYVAITYK